MQPGSSIMPGKVNPVIPEVVNQVCFQIIGYDVTISMAAEASELELNMAEPIIAYDLLHGLLILQERVRDARRAAASAASPPTRSVCRGYVENIIGLVTALDPVLGYESRRRDRQGGAGDRAAACTTSCCEKGWLDDDELDGLLAPEAMTDPRTGG